MHYVYIIQERVSFNTSFVGFLGWQNLGLYGLPLGLFGSKDETKKRCFKQN